MPGRDRTHASPALSLLAAVTLMAVLVTACAGAGGRPSTERDEAEGRATGATPPATTSPPATSSPDVSDDEGMPGGLVVSDNRRFLQHADGRPFFYLGDTAWELFHRLSREEVETYLEDRRSKGFTVIQSVALAEQGGLSVPNAYGHLPLVDRDPTRPDVRAGPADDYWDHVDHVVRAVGDKGMHVGLLPTWGDKVEKLWGGDGEPVFTTQNARAYGRFLGERYRDSPNVIWILGGDRGPNPYDVEIWREMARGLREGDGGAHLVTFHPQGGRTSSALLHDDDLFDFNMVQSGHCADDEAAAAMIRADYEKDPPRPVIDGEPRYEDHPKCFEPEQGWWDGHDARRSAWVQTFSGAFGHTYGHHAVWQFHAPERSGVSWVRTYWRDALDHPGASQVGHVRRLLESRPFLSRVPDQGVLTGDHHDSALLRATRDADGSWAAVYAATGGSFSVDLRALSGDGVRAWWFDPRTGAPGEPWDFANTKAPMTFDPPGRPAPDDDWVLVLDDAARSFGPPGSPLQ